VINVLVAALSVVVLLCVIGLVQLRGAAPQTFEMELVKALIQVCIVAVGGTVISVAVFEYQRSRQRDDAERETRQSVSEYRDELLMQSLAKASACYSLCKKSRRILRARALVGSVEEATLCLEAYYENIEKLSEVQLDLEYLAGEISNTAPAFSMPDELLKDVRIVDQYLSGLIKEYEGARLVQRTSDGNLPLSSLPVLQDFLKRSEEGSFLAKVTTPLKNLQQTIRRDMLHAKLNVETLSMRCF